MGGTGDRIQGVKRKIYQDEVGEKNTRKEGKKKIMLL